MHDEDNRGCPACTMDRDREEGREGERAQGREGERAQGRAEARVEEELQSRLSVCPHYAHLRMGLDISTTEGMVSYFQSVLKEGDMIKVIYWFIELHMRVSLQ